MAKRWTGQGSALLLRSLEVGQSHDFPMITGVSRGVLKNRVSSCVQSLRQKANMRFSMRRNPDGSYTVTRET